MMLQLLKAHSEGLRMTGQPAANADATLCAAMIEGAFHGAMATAGPKGLDLTKTGFTFEPSSWVSSNALATAAALLKHMRLAMSPIWMRAMGGRRRLLPPTM